MMRWTLNKNRLVWAMLGSLALIVAFLLAATVAVGGNLPADSTVATPFPNCRYGVAATVNQPDWLTNLGVGWYLDFGAHAPIGPGNLEFAQVIRIKQNKSGCTYLSGYSATPPLTDASGGLGELVSATPGALWIVGNEPDRGPNPEDSQCVNRAQDDTKPEIYAQAYHDIYEFIKQRDATAQLGNAGLVEVTPGRLQYLDKVWQAYLQLYHVPMPVDVWNIHLYILPETLANGQPNGIANVALGTDTSLAIRESGNDPRNCTNPTDNVYCWAEHDNLTTFADQVVKMRTWMKQHGQQNKPLILSEYSILYPPDMQDEYGRYFSFARVSSFMTQTFNYLESTTDPNLGYPLDHNRLVQQWLWYGLYHNGAGAGSSLLSADLTSLTQVGQVFSSTVRNLTTYADLVPGRAASVVAFTSAPSETVTATLSADIYNHGNISASGPITVTFYSTEQTGSMVITETIGSAVITEALGGCARRFATVTTTWADLAAGPHHYWVDVEGDSYTTDNVAEGLVLVNPTQVFLPLVLR
jgi:hypothetical protein